MRCPALNELPPPPPDKTGWPWTEESPQLAYTMPDGSLWPMISILTPSYNHGQFLEEAIRSVLLQGYPNLEYIVIDGGSTDDSVEILKKYGYWISYWESQADRGQSHAINKGFSRATGEIYGWLNSDDLYCRNSLGRVVRAFTASDCDVISGNTVYLERGNRTLRKTPSKLSVSEMLKRSLNIAPQPSTFWRRKCWTRYGPLDEDLHYRMDYAFFLCLAASELRWLFCDEDLALFRRHEAQKTWAWSDTRFHHEKNKAIRRFAEYDSFGQIFSKDIDRALNYEGWLVSWMAINHVHDGSVADKLRMLTAPFYNWRCLIMPYYYRKVLNELLKIPRLTLRHRCDRLAERNYKS